MILFNFLTFMHFQTCMEYVSSNMGKLQSWLAVIWSFIAL